MFGQVHKFGPTSLSSSKRLKATVSIINKLQKDKPHIVVVASAQGVDEQIRNFANALETPTWQLENLKNQQLELINSLFSGERREELVVSLLYDIAMLRLLIAERGTPTTQILAIGENWSARIISELLREHGHTSQIISPCSFLQVDSQGKLLNNNWSREQILIHYNDAEFVIVPGYLANENSEQNLPISDDAVEHTSALTASAVDAEKLIIWTDVEGIRSADPDFIKETHVLPKLSYQEAQNIANSGSGIIPANLIQLLADHKIPIEIRSCFRPEGGRTLISLQGSKQGILALGCQGPYTVLRIPKNLLTNGDFQGSLAAKRTRCITHNEWAFMLASPLLEAEFLSSFSFALADPDTPTQVYRESSLIVLTLGDESAGLANLKTDLANNLKKCPFDIEVLYGEEKSISILVSQRHSYKALTWLHNNCLPRSKVFAVAIVGAGNVGTTLFQQIDEGLQRTFQDHALLFEVKAVANSRRMLLANEAIDIQTWLSASHEDHPTDLDRLTQHMLSFDQEAIIIDTTASSEVADLHQHWLEKGIHVITANKISCSSHQYFDLVKLCQGKRVKYLYETTVGAGLPVIQVAKSLVDSGDQLLELEAILSGSLSYLFMELEKGCKFSEAILALKEKGYTEPDPRIDLSGLDVGRKLTILARQFGLQIQLDDIEISPVIPDDKPLQSIADFLASVEGFNSYFEKLLTEAKQENKILRYVARLNRSGLAKIGIEKLDRSHGFALLNPADNIIQFKTIRYSDNPLFVRGPGAGLEVTAAGLYNDMLRLALV